MKVAITGASGFIGRHLLVEFQRRQWPVRALQHRSPLASNAPHETVVGDIGDSDAPYQIVAGDIGDSAALKQLTQGADMLFHLAAALGASLISEEDFFRINVEGTRNALEAAKANRVKRVIHFSSAGVLGAVKEGEVADELYPARPRNIYDSTKLEAEKEALRFAGEGMDMVIVRPGWVYGPADRRTFKLIKAIAKGRFALVTRGEAWQTPIYIDDLVQGVLLCAERGFSGEVYNIAGDEVLPVREIAAAIAEVTQRRLPSFTLPLLPVKTAAKIMEKAFALFKKESPLTTGRLAFFIHPKPLSIAKAAKELGFAPRVDFKTGMMQTVAWCKDHDWL